jgi:glucose-1-phosphate adenylyltransferase
LQTIYSYWVNEEGKMPAANDILAVILGGGRGSRLYPLTQQRSKPAVPIAGKYRLIDVPISNCINSGIYRIAVLTQFNSVSLNRHVSRTYQFDAFHGGWVQIWAAEQTMENADWYQGTADAVRKQMLEIRSARVSHVLILAGDHLYRMDYAAMYDFHIQNNADITVAVQPVAKEDAGRFGTLKRSSDARIVQFAEKPKEPELLKEMISRDDPQKPYLGSMGIYLFKIDVLFDLLEDKTFADFGGDVIPHAIKCHTVFGYDFDDYWEDIGTIRSFYDTNLMLTRSDSPFNFFDPQKPIYTVPRYLPGSKVLNSVMENVLLTEGCYIKNAVIRHSVIGVRSQINDGAEIVDSVLMGADYYDRDLVKTAVPEIPIGIGSGCKIQGAIIDKNARLGENVIIKPFPRGTERDATNWVVRDGIVVIPKNAVIESGTYIGPA